ncbi:hypothetical protein DAI22_01g419201 [Oryza sativa Japonica Group]|jgi:hypothetical protein|nr:hypothetical protein DAI22_01g419201 [Oryza sativa Japonica Group]
MVKLVPWTSAGFLSWIQEIIDDLRARDIVRQSCDLHGVQVTDIPALKPETEGSFDVHHCILLFVFM